MIREKEQQVIKYSKTDNYCDSCGSNLGNGDKCYCKHCRTAISVNWKGTMAEIKDTIKKMKGQLDYMSEILQKVIDENW